MEGKLVKTDMKKPLKVYKYQSINQYSLMNLLMGGIWFSNPTRFNDPYEARFAYEKRRFFKTEDDIARSLIVQSSSDKENTIQTIEYLYEFEKGKRVDLMRETVISCFTQKPDDLIMWAHYGDSHKGMCIEYNTKHRVFKDIQAVEYSDEYPEILEHIFEDDKKKMFLHKGNAWKYEHEYRVIKLKSKERSYACKGAISAIYFGCNTQKTDIDFIVGEMKAKIKSIQFYKFELSDEKYELVPIQIG